MSRLAFGICLRALLVADAYPKNTIIRNEATTNDQAVDSDMVLILEANVEGPATGYRGASFGVGVGC